MRDGVTLRANVYRPANGHSAPVLLLRLPYDKEIAQSYVYAHPAWCVRRGYVVVTQDTRGRHASEGDFYPLRHDDTDGYDTIEWCASLPWSNGRVGTYGFSYPGINQLLAAAERPPHLAATAPAFCPNGMYDGWSYVGGAFALAAMAHWAVILGGDAARRARDPAAAAAVREADRMVGQWPPSQPLRDLQLFGDRSPLPFLSDYFQHPSHDAYWREWDLEPRYERIAVPALHIGGWYDTFISATIRNYERLTQLGRSEQRLLIGPWAHIPWTQTVGALDFGEEARNTVSAYQLAWFDAWLKDDRTCLAALPPVRLFLLGENRWRDYDRWPPPDTVEQPYFLHSDGAANSLAGDGALDQVPPQDEPPDFYVYTPADPVPSRGGHSGFDPERTPMGPQDQRPVQSRNDVLVYTSEPLAEPLEAIGRVQVHLFAATSARDTDFTATLCDVFPDGRAINLCEGIVRGRYRESLEAPALLDPDRVYEFTIDLGVVCNLFRPGHRLCLHVSSSNYPAFDRNPNTGGPFAQESPFDLIPASQVVLHSARYPSRLMLPVGRP